MINPSIETSDFLFWHEKIWSWVFEDFFENRQTKFHILKFRVCVNTKFELVKCALSVSHEIFKTPTLNFYYDKIEKSELSIDGLIISVQLLTFGVRKRQKFFVK